MLNKHTTIYVASAGTGKTTTLMDNLTDCLEYVDPQQICFTTFTKVGAQEAIDRALDKNPDYNEKDFEAFSTLHALCYRRIPRKQMLTSQDYRLLSELTVIRSPEVLLTVTTVLSTITMPVTVFYIITV